MAIRRGYRGVCVLTGAVLAAGLASGPASASQAAAHRATAPRWHIVKTIKKATLQLWDVVALKSGRVWVSGGLGYPNTVPLLLHRVGTKWITILRPGMPSTYVWATSLSATSDTNVWAQIVNSDAVDHWNGSSWTRFHFGGVDTARTSNVVAVGMHDAWLFTHNFNTSTETSEFFDGSAFHDASFPVFIGGYSAPVNWVSASSPSNIWGVGYDPLTQKSTSVHFDGKTWTVVPIPPIALGPTGGPAEILAESAKNVWGTVFSQNSLAGPIKLLHWNGTAWHRAGGLRPAGDLTGPIAPDGHGGLWLIAARPKKTWPFFTSFFVHYGGGVWKAYAVPTSPLGPVEITAMALIPGTKSLWGVGYIPSKTAYVAGVIVKFGP
jgi:hypothetical protein